MPPGACYLSPRHVGSETARRCRQGGSNKRPGDPAKEVVMLNKYRRKKCRHFLWQAAAELERSETYYSHGRISRLGKKLLGVLAQELDHRRIESDLSRLRALE